MERNIYKLLLFMCFLNANSQIIEKKDYDLLNEILPDLLFIKNADTIKIYENTVAFLNQEAVFTKDFFLNYTYPTIGVDSKKVKKLIKRLDFGYLAKQTKETSTWELDKIKYPIVKYEAKSTDNISLIKNQKLFGISKPIYSKNGTMAFIYYEYYCGLLCGETGMKIYKKKKGRWVFYLQIPIWIS